MVLLFPEEPQFVFEFVELLVFGSESATFRIENGDLLFVDGAEFFNGTLPPPLLFCPSAEFTKSPNKLGFFSTIAMPEDGAEEDQLLPKMSPTMEVGWLGAAAGGGWWVQDGLFGCQAGLAWAEE